MYFDIALRVIYFQTVHENFTFPRSGLIARLNVVLLVQKERPKST